MQKDSKLITSFTNNKSNLKNEMFISMIVIKICIKFYFKNINKNHKIYFSNVKKVKLLKNVLNHDINVQIF